MRQLLSSHALRVVAPFLNDVAWNAKSVAKDGPALHFATFLNLAKYSDNTNNAYVRRLKNKYLAEAIHICTTDV